MKKYTESELQELLRQQREICAKPFVQSIAERIRETPSPPTEEEGIKEDDVEEYKKDNQSRWITNRELFKEFVQSLLSSEQGVKGSDTSKAQSMDEPLLQNKKY